MNPDPVSHNQRIPPSPPDFAITPPEAPVLPKVCALAEPQFDAPCYPHDYSQSHPGGPSMTAPDASLPPKAAAMQTPGDDTKNHFRHSSNRFLALQCSDPSFAPLDPDGNLSSKFV